jgi:hypothetical protein
MPHAPLLRRVTLLAAVLALLSAAAPAGAHKQAMKLSVGPLVGSTSPIQIRKAGVLSITPFGGGTVILALKNMRDAFGNKMYAFDNELRLSLRVNGVPTAVAFPFNIKNGKGTLRTVITPAQDLFKGDLVELVDVDLVDKDGVQFGVLGVPAGTRTTIHKTALVYVTDSVSEVHFSRGGDSRLKLRDNGNFNTGFDTLLDPLGEKINTPQVKVELVMRINGGAPTLFTYNYDIINGRSVPDGRPHIELGLQITDTVEVQRLDVFDNLGNRFATMGFKVVSPRAPMP